MALTPLAKKMIARFGLVAARSHRVSEIDLFGLVVEAEMQRPRNEPFFFVQVGANDGKMHDPIRRFVDKYRWHGLLVEPIPHLYKNLVNNYRDHPQLQFENCAIAPAEGTLTLYKVPDNRVTGEFATGLASFDQKILLKHRDLGLKPADLEVVKVPSMPLSTLFRKHSISHVDLLQIDTEGFDYQVLKLFDFTRMQPRIVQFEHVHLDLDDQMAAFNLLRSHGYQVTTCHTDVVAIIPPADS